MSIDTLRQHLQAERDFNQKMADHFLRNDNASQAEHHQELADRRNEWLRDLEALTAEKVEVQREHPVKSKK